LKIRRFAKILIFVEERQKAQRLRGNYMKCRAVIKKSGDWWIGWLIDLPGVNAQGIAKSELIASLRIGAEDMLDTEVPFEPGCKMPTVDIPDPALTKHTI